MSLSSRHAIATHILLVLACTESARVSSEYIAGSVNTNPVVVRRLLSDLKRAGLVGVQKGAEGGYFLLKKSSQISLWDVFQAVEELPIFVVHTSPPNPRCKVGGCVEGLLKDVYKDVESALVKRLKAVTLCCLSDCVGKS